MLLNVVQDLTLVVVGFTMAPALAHALELPGKMRVTKDVYLNGIRRFSRSLAIAPGMPI